MGVEINDKIAALISLAAYTLGMATTIATVMAARQVAQFVFRLMLLPEEVFSNKLLFEIMLVFVTVLVLFYIAGLAITKFLKIGHYYYLKMQNIEEDADANKDSN